MPLDAPWVRSSQAEGTEPWSYTVPSFVFDRVLAGGDATLVEELAAACPTLVPLLSGSRAPLALVGDCARPEARCESAARGSLRMVADYSSTGEASRTSTHRSVYVDLERCLFRGWSQEATSTERFKTVTYWSNSTEAVSESDETFEGIAWRPSPTAPPYQVTSDQPISASTAP